MHEGNLKRFFGFDEWYLIKNKHVNINNNDFSSLKFGDKELMCITLLSEKFNATPNYIEMMSSVLVTLSVLDSSKCINANE